LRVESELFRVAQKALTNVRKHAHASDVEVALRLRGQTLTLSVRDNGRGFSPRTRGSDGIDQTQCHGLVGMRERAKLLGGRLQVSSAPGQGTRILARVPIRSEEEPRA